ncbi:hypothetical protein MMC08_006349 [Hypocenomyce scalaris]|nr:hypothetical protein [Hypocenomyce scalaris]
MLILTLFIAFFALLTAGQQNTFYNPSNTAYGEIVHNYTLDDVWPLGSVQNITWSTSYKNSTLILWQNNNPNYETFIASGPSPDYYYWNPITTTQDLANGTVFFFQVHDLSGSGDIFGSHYFNLTASATASTGAATATATATATGTASASPQSSSSSSGGMSSGTKAGIGVGVGVGIPLIAAIAIGFFLLSRRRRQRNTTPPAYAAQDDNYKYVGQHPTSRGGLQEMPADYQLQELPGQNLSAELPIKYGQ